MFQKRHNTHSMHPHLLLPISSVWWVNTFVFTVMQRNDIFSLLKRHLKSSKIIVKYYKAKNAISFLFTVYECSTTGSQKWVLPNHYDSPCAILWSVVPNAYRIWLDNRYHKAKWQCVYFENDSRSWSLVVFKNYCIGIWIVFLTIFKWLHFHLIKTISSDRIVKDKEILFASVLKYIRLHQIPST